MQPLAHFGLACLLVSSSIAGAAPPGPASVSGELSFADWSKIRAACDARRYAAVKTDFGLRAENPGQQWTTSFDGRGFLTVPRGGGWNWGLELSTYGRAAEQRKVTVPREVTAGGQRVAYEWDGLLTEWYINDQRGLEHGYTLRDRPGGEDHLVFTLAIRGGLRADVSRDGRDVLFVDERNATVLRYSGLSVLDAGGRALAARFEPTQGGLRLAIDDRLADYPLTIDPIAQQAYLKASNTDGNDQLGFSVAVSERTVVVGAPHESSAATGVDGDQGNDGAAFRSGAAYVFVRHGATWTQQAYLKASNTDRLDEFGGSVAVSGDTVVIGARHEASGATGVNGNDGDNSQSSSGAAYVFSRNGATWTQQAYLKASNTDAGDLFGQSLAISGDTIVIGAPNEDSGATGINGAQGNGLLESGAAYVFVRNGTTWTQQAYLKASNTDGDDRFGSSVAISGDTVVIGANNEGSGATGVDGDQGNTFAGRGSGAAYVFVRDGTTWKQTAYLKASNTDADDRFGQSVAISGDRLAVGAPEEDSAARGVDGNQGNGGSTGFSSGALYLFGRNGATWTQEAYLKASNSATGIRLGCAVAVAADTLIAGARDERGSATGVDGDQSDSGLWGAGAAYAFNLTHPWSDQGSALAGVSGDPSLEGSGPLAGASSNTVALTNAAPSATAALFLAPAANPVPFKGGTLLPFPFLIPPVIVSTDANGAIQLPFTLPPGVPAGTELWVQWGIADASAVQGVALSNALLGVTQ